MLIVSCHSCLALSASCAEFAHMQAKKRQPENPQVIASINAGVTNATIWHTESPDDVVSWLKKYHNQFHTGAGYSFVECMEDPLFC